MVLTIDSTGPAVVLTIDSTGPVVVLIVVSVGPDMMLTMDKFCIFSVLVLKRSK